MNDSKSRKAQPVFSGCLMYFPDALLAIAEHSRKANDKHNPGEPLHWSKDKSKDHADCIGRHLLDIGPDWNAVDPEFGSYHATALAWRALALLETVLEREQSKALNATEIMEQWREQRIPPCVGHAFQDDAPMKWERDDNKWAFPNLRP